MKLCIKIEIIGILFLLVIVPGKGQDTQEAKKTWAGDVSLGLALTRGNTDTSNLSFSFSANKNISAEWEWHSSGSFLLGKIKNQTNAESLSLSSGINWKHSARVFSYFKLQALRDRFKNYDYRLLPTIGVGYKLISSEKTDFSMEIGFSEVFTRYRDSGNTESYLGISWGNSLSWNISPNAELKQKFTFNTDLTDFPHFFAQLEMSLAAAIAKGWALKVSLIDSFDNQPVGEGIKKNDAAFLAGLSMKF